MKNLILLLVAFFVFVQIIFAQNVNIPDANFKQVLLADTAINTNGDNEIQVAEAQVFAGTIDAAFKQISDFTGIEAFPNITRLICYYNQFTTLNVSSNIALTHLICGNSGLSSLDLSNNTTLEYLDCSSAHLTNLNLSNNSALTEINCSDNLLTSLDFSSNSSLEKIFCYNNNLNSINIGNNTILTSLFCEDNNLTSLDVSLNTTLNLLHCDYNSLNNLNLGNNTSLEFLYCQYNQLTTLDVNANSGLRYINCQNNKLTSLNVKNGNNANFNYFNSTSNLDLDCIEVDDSTYSTINWTNIDPGSYFSNSCYTSTHIISSLEIGVDVYPNPTNDKVFLSFDKIHQNIKLKIYNPLGVLLTNKEYLHQQNLELTLGSNVGVYFVIVETEAGVSTLKVLKK